MSLEKIDDGLRVIDEVDDGLVALVVDLLLLVSTEGLHFFHNIDDTLREIDVVDDGLEVLLVDVFLLVEAAGGLRLHLLWLQGVDSEMRMTF